MYRRLHSLSDTDSLCSSQMYCTEGSTLFQTLSGSVLIRCKKGSTFCQKITAFVPVRFTHRINRRPLSLFDNQRLFPSDIRKAQIYTRRSEAPIPVRYTLQSFSYTYELRSSHKYGRIISFKHLQYRLSSSQK